jgi:hypothetical protein
MSIRFYLSDDGHLSPRPSGYSPTLAVHLKAPMTVWRRPLRHRLAWPVAGATTVATIAVLLASQLR